MFDATGYSLAKDHKKSKSKLWCWDPLPQSTSFSWELDCLELLVIHSRSKEICLPL